MKPDTVITNYQLCQRTVAMDLGAGCAGWAGVRDQMESRYTYTARSTTKGRHLSLMIQTRPRVRHDDGGRVGVQVHYNVEVAEHLEIGQGATPGGSLRETLPVHRPIPTDTVQDPGPEAPAEQPEQTDDPTGWSLPPLGQAPVVRGEVLEDHLLH